MLSFLCIGSSCLRDGRVGVLRPFSFGPRPHSDGVTVTKQGYPQGGERVGEGLVFTGNH